LKKFLVLLMVLMLTVPVFANKIGVEVKKDVNDGYVVSMPIDMDAQAQLPFLPKAYLKTACVFTAPRGEFIGSMKSLNHSHFDATIGGEITILEGKLQLETGARNYWGGNDAGIAEGLYWNNSARYFYEF